MVCACIPHTARRHIFFSSSSSGSCSLEFLPESCDYSRSVGYHIIGILSRNAPEVRLKYETAEEGTPQMVWNAISRYATRGQIWFWIFVIVLTQTCIVFY